MARTNKTTNLCIRPFKFGKGILIQSSFILAPILVKTSWERNRITAKVIMLINEDKLKLLIAHLDMAELGNGNCVSPRPIKKDHIAQKMNLAITFVMGFVF